MTTLAKRTPYLAPLVEFITRRPCTAFAMFLALQFAVWTILPSLLNNALPLDGLEALIYGREWQLGYAKLSPLPWWVAEAVYRVLPYDAAYYALSQLFVVATFAVVWVMARRLVGDVGALVSVLIVDGLDYFQSASTHFNHDVAQLPFWALAGYALHAALRNGRHRDWALLGASLGAAFWAKYFVVILALPIVLFLILDRDARASLRRPGPWIAVAVGLLVVLPHLIWLVQHNFIPFDYVDRRASPSRGITDHIVHPVKFVLGQLGYLLPSLLIAAPLVYFSFLKPAAAPAQPVPMPGFDAYDRRIVTLLAFGPALTMVVLSAVTGRGTIALWGYPLWLYLGLWFVMTYKDALASRGLAWIASLWGVVFAASCVFIIIYNSGALGLSYVRRSQQFPGPQLAAEIERQYFAVTGRAPAYIVGPQIEAGNISRYSSNRPRVVIDADFAKAPWIDPSDLRTKGAILIWNPSDDGLMPDHLKKIAEGAPQQPPIVIPVANGRFKFHFAWAILKPR
ncbi:UDP-phosphomannose--protein mannosyltransferase [soil metagenome]